jgi:hypothetical protein
MHWDHEHADGVARRPYPDLSTSVDSNKRSKDRRMDMGYFKQNRISEFAC